MTDEGGLDCGPKIMLTIANEWVKKKKEKKSLTAFPWLRRDGDEKPICASIAHASEYWVGSYYYLSCGPGELEAAPGRNQSWSPSPSLPFFYRLPARPPTSKVNKKKRRQIERAHFFFFLLADLLAQLEFDFERTLAASGDGEGR